MTSSVVRPSVVCLSLLLTTTAALAQGTPTYVPSASETWHAVDAGGAPYGSIVTRRETLPDGKLRIIQTARSRIDFLGRRQEIVGRFEAVVTSELEPASCEFRSDGPSGSATVEGTAKDGMFVLTLRRGGVSLERRIPLTNGLIFGICLSDALARSQADEMKLSILDVDSWGAEPVVARRLPNEPDLRRWSVEYARGWGSGIWSLTPSGAWAGAEIQSPRRTVRPASADIDAKLKYWTLADRELFVFPTQRDIPFPERLVELKVRLSWKGVPPERLHLEDSRQRIAERRTTEDRHEVEVLLKQPPEIRNPPPLPVTDVAFGPSLGETTYIRPRHSAIRKQARAWTRGSQTTLDAVRKLSREVSQFLEAGEMIAETLSGPEVLACRKGKCSEFTTLFASLSRSVGVPTRVALGMRLVGGRWVGHMWCEVWVGRWIPVDSAADEVGGSPALLKLAHSDDEMASQAVRWALTDSLDVEIIGVEQVESGTPKLKTGIAGDTYVHADFACRLKAPTPDWRLSDRSTPGVVKIRFDPPGEFENGTPKIEFIALSMPVKIETASLMATVKAGLAAKFTGLEILGDDEKTIGPLSGRLLVFRRNDPKAAGGKLKASEFICLTNGSLFLITLMADESTHDAVFRQYEALLNGFKIVGPASPAR